MVEKKTMKSVTSNVLFLIAEKAITTLILLASNIVVIRYLGVEDFGRLALFQVYYAMAVTVSEFGVRRVYSSLKNKRREALIFHQAFNIKIISSIILLTGTLFFLILHNFDIEYYFICICSFTI